MNESKNLGFPIEHKEKRECSRKLQSRKTKENQKFRAGEAENAARAMSNEELRD